MKSTTSSAHTKNVESGRAGGDGDGVSQLASKASETASSIVERAEKSIGDASASAEATVRKMLAQAGETASDLADTGRSAANAVAHQINHQPLAAMLLFAATIGYVASFLMHGRIKSTLNRGRARTVKPTTSGLTLTPVSRAELFR
jgi:ElaB/YqjD/DUF883 family membrane-anchored ribosome-binding protein